MRFEYRIFIWMPAITLLRDTSYGLLDSIDGKLRVQTADWWVNVLGAIMHFPQDLSEHVWYTTSYE